VFFSKRRLIAFLFLFCVVLFLFFLSSQESVYTFRSVFSDVSKIPLLIVHGVTEEFKAVIFFHKSYWENRELLQENDALKSHLLKEREILQENERLKKMLDLKTSLPFNTIAAFVIGKDFNAFRSSLILDKGRAAGVKKYAPVLTSLGLVGKVLETGRYSCKVILIDDPDLAVPAINLRTREQGLVSGTLDGRCKMRFLDIDSDVRPGDFILTSGLNGAYPVGVLIGRVRLVGVESSGLGKFVILEPAVKISSLEEVLIEKTTSTS
jgi:rod shape-determining protein MreC